MATYTIEKLQEKLDKNLAIRKQELTLLKTNVMQAEGLNLNTSIRIGIVMIYAHWEGFIKIAAREYLKYLNCMNINREQLKDNFITLAIKPIIRDCSKSLKTEKHCEIINALFNNNTSVFNVDVMNELIVNTESNLSYPVLQDILFNLGLEKGSYELKANYIKDELLEKRNAIAHGELIEMKSQRTNTNSEQRKNEFEKLHMEMIALMEKFKEQILDSAINQLYLKESNVNEV